MNLKRGAVICGIAAIPLWYAYRSVGQHRAISVDEVFADEATILRHELEETKRKAAEDLENAKLENTPEAQLRIVAAKAHECVQSAEAIRSKYGTFVREQSSWRKELQDIKHSSTGAAIAASHDYVLVFRSFTETFRPETDLQNSVEGIEPAESACREGEAKPTTEWVAGRDAVDRLTKIEKAIDESRSELAKAQSDLRWLAHIAAGEALDPLEIAIGKQRVAELAGLEKEFKERVCRVAY
jgi:hypothetical protein